MAQRRQNERCECFGSSRTTRMTRSLNDASTRTGSRSARATSLIFTLSSSRTMHLTQQLAETVAGAHDTHLERRHSDPGKPRHLVVGQFLHILQQKRFALLRAKPLQGAIDLLTPGTLLGRMVLRRTQESRFVEDERFRPPTTACAQSPTPVDENAEQPGAEALRVVAPCKRAIRAGKRVLQRFFGILTVAEHVQRVPGVPIAVALHETA